MHDLAAKMHLFIFLSKLKINKQTYIVHDIGLSSLYVADFLIGDYSDLGDD